MTMLEAVWKNRPDLPEAQRSGQKLVTAFEAL